MFRPDVNEISLQLSLFLQSEKVSLLLSIGICNIFPDDFMYWMLLQTEPKGNYIYFSYP